MLKDENTISNIFPEQAFLLTSYTMLFWGQKMEGEEDMLEQVIVLVWRCYLSLRVDNTRIYVNESIVCQMSVFRRQT